MRLSGTLIGIVAALLVAGCSAEAEFSVGEGTINHGEVEEQISAALADTYGEPPKSLRCPEGIEVKEGESFACEGESPDPGSRAFEIEVTMTDDEGGIRYPTTVTFTEPAPASGPPS